MSNTSTQSAHEIQRARAKANATAEAMQLTSQENNKLRALNAELLAACKRLLPVVGKLSVVGGYIKAKIEPHDAESFHSAYSNMRSLIARAEGKKS